MSCEPYAAREFRTLQILFTSVRTRASAHEIFYVHEICAGRVTSVSCGPPARLERTLAHAVLRRGNGVGLPEDCARVIGRLCLTCLWGRIPACVWHLCALLLGPVNCSGDEPPPFGDTAAPRADVHTLRPAEPVETSVEALLGWFMGVYRNSMSTESQHSAPPRRAGSCQAPRSQPASSRVPEPPCLAFRPRPRERA